MKNIYKLCSSKDKTVQLAMSEAARKLFCILTYNYIKLIKIDGNDMKLLIICAKCDLCIENPNMRAMFSKLEEMKVQNYAFFNIHRHRKNENLVNVIYKAHLTYLEQSNEEQINLNAIVALKNISGHMPSFYAKNCDIWLNYIGSDNKNMRLAMNDVIYHVFLNFLVSV